MQRVPFGAGRLVNELVLEQARPLAIERGNDVHDSLVAGHPLDRRAQVDYGIEAIEPALAALAVVLPPAAEIVEIDQFAAGEDAVGLFRYKSDLLKAKDAANDR